MSAIKPATAADVESVRTALSQLREARKLLLAAGATKAAEKVAAAIKSTEGAQRHVERRSRA